MHANSLVTVHRVARLTYLVTIFHLAVHKTPKIYLLLVIPFVCDWPNNVFCFNFCSLAILLDAAYPARHTVVVVIINDIIIILDIVDTDNIPVVVFGCSSCPLQRKRRRVGASLVATEQRSAGEHLHWPRSSAPAFERCLVRVPLASGSV